MSEVKKKFVTAYQITTYLFLGLKISTFSAIIIPSFRTGYQILFSLLYFSGIIPLIYLGYRHTVIDLTDPIVKMERKAKRDGTPFDSDEYEYHCPYCETSVSENAKHCRECNKCVRDFDHHCKWVNNCISKTNYKSFIIMLVCVLVTTIVFCIACTLYIIDLYTANVQIINFDNSFNVYDDHETRKGLTLLVDSLAAIFAFLDMKLLWFHMYLIRMNLTTYDYIMQKRNGSPKRIKRESKNKVHPEKIITSTEGKMETEAHINQGYVSQITGNSETPKQETPERNQKKVDIRENIRNQISKQVALEFPTDTSQFDTKTPVNEQNQMETPPKQQKGENSKTYAEEIIPKINNAEESQRTPIAYERSDPAGDTRESLLHPNKKVINEGSNDIINNQKLAQNKTAKMDKSKL